MKDLLFSLDIGTRNVVGVLSKIENDKYIVVDYEQIEHPDRAMYDGQIHDIGKVADVAQRVKENLEKRNNIELKHVSIAAAGRALKTNRVTIEMDSDAIKEINKNNIDSLNLLGIETAQEQLIKEENLETSYYCVGYTVINYFLDGKTISNLKGHKGNKIGVELIATFLPHVVVDSLYTVVHRVGLEVINMTLEPIAAINIAIPENFRLLNLALVDIGAGTSDIAITKDGAITSYSMVAYAGDKLTEALSQKYLLDFDSAEKVKTRLSEEENHRFNDIIGIEHKQSTDEIMSGLSDVLSELATNISEAIVDCNTKAPSAVFCIGGSSKIPGLQQAISEKLNVPPERIVIKNTSDLQNVEFKCEPMNGPEYVTPLGIGYTAYKDKEQDFLKVTVNDKLVRLFKSRELSVADALLLVGFSARKLLGKKGNSVVVNINGKDKYFFGETGDPASIYINDEVARLDSKVQNNDVIRIAEATNGSDAKVYLRDIVDTTKYFELNGERVAMFSDILVNGREANLHYRLKNNDLVTFTEIKTVDDMKKENKLTEDLSVVINEVAATSQQILKNGDSVSFKEAKKSVVKPKPQEKDVNSYINITINSETIKLDKKSNLMFVEIFNHIQFDLDRPKGTLNLTLNGVRANYTDLLKDGDVITLEWM